MTDLRVLARAVNAGLVQELDGDPFPVDPGSRWAGFPPAPDLCTRVEPMAVEPVRTAVEQPATPFGPAPVSFELLEPPFAVTVLRAVEHAASVAQGEPCTFDILFEGTVRGTFFVGEFGWLFDAAPNLSYAVTDEGSF